MGNPALNKEDVVRAEINYKHSKWMHNSSEDSFYSESNNSEKSTNERCSFHYPVLERWLQMAMKRFQNKTTKYNPLIGQNIAFTFHDKNTTGTTNPNVSAKLMDAAQKLFRSGNNFVVTLYDWDLDLLSVNEIKLIFQNINNSFISQEFSDPLANTEHKAVKTPIEAIIKPVNNQETNEDIKMNKKQTIRLNEAQFNRIVKQAVKRVLKENEDDFSSLENWSKNVHIPQHIMTMVETICEKLDCNFSGEEEIDMNSVYGESYGVGKGFVISICTSSLERGPENKDKINTLTNWLRGLDFESRKPYGDNGLGWHDSSETFFNYPFVYKPSIYYY